MYWKKLVDIPFLRVPLTVLLDLLLIGGCATILWNGGGATVVSGSWMSQAGCVVLATVLLAARHALYTAHRDMRKGRISIPTEWAIVAIDLVGVVALITAWGITQRYFIGWIAAFGALFLMLGSTWQLLGALVTPPPVDGYGPRQRARAASILASAATLRASTAAFGVAGLVFTAPIHGWSPSILGGLIILITGSVVLAVVLRAWVGAAIAKPVEDQAPGPRRAPVVTTDDSV